MLAIGTSLPFFLWHWVHFTGLLGQPGLEAVTRPGVLAGLNALVLAAAIADVLLLLWLWPQRHRPGPLPRTAVLVVLVQVTAYCGMGIAFGALTSPFTTIFISAIAVGLALLGRRPTAIGFAFAFVAITLNDWLVMAGVVPYAPALVPGTFRDGQAVAWWAHWQDFVYFFALVLGVGLMVSLFAYLDRQRELLEALSCTDGLTQLANRRHFMERLAIEQHRRERYNVPYCLVLGDADHFKRINDSFGHHTGDEVLKHIGRLLAGGLRVPGDVAARIGGEEFALLLTDCREAEVASVCERLRSQLAGQEFEIDGHRVRATMSMGAVECRGGSAEAALKAADANLYRGKHEGRDRVVVTVQEDVS
ncbi:MAG: hypothetical protein K0S16_2267 [Moraxellaceae bacterium]|nr:hypothetical protein [Moraxellaceae bacterium]